MKVLVLGGVAAGTKVAAKLMREDRSNEVTILNKGKNISYAGCGLPYYVGHVIEDRDQLIVNTPEKYSKLTGVEVLTEVEATKVDVGAKKVTAVDFMKQHFPHLRKSSSFLFPFNPLDFFRRTKNHIHRHYQQY